MKVALIAPPFIEIPPKRYGGTELFIANLACELLARGHEVVVYGNGDSRLPCRVKWRYPHAQWPLEDLGQAALKNLDHTAWAVEDAAAWADVLHLNDATGIPLTRFVDLPAVYTIHHPYEPHLSELYARYPAVHYVALASWLARRERAPLLHAVHHGIPPASYRFSAEKDDYVAFLGRMAPCKGPHLAIDAARLAGVPIKLAGEIQPTYREYWEEEVRPRIDGRDVEYVGEADMEAKNQLLSRARALLFPIQWEEPFGLVMIEAMACGTPVLGFAGGSVEEVIQDGENGWVCGDVADMARRLAALDIPAASCRASVERSFSVARMTSRYIEVYERARKGRGVSAPVTIRAPLPLGRGETTTLRSPAPKTGTA